jgi:hypothetical protein
VHHGETVAVQQAFHRPHRLQRMKAMLDPHLAVFACHHLLHVDTGGSQKVSAGTRVYPQRT